MAFHKLNFDVICEILKHFVAIVDEGPLTLIMVCTSWRNLVISNHVYWTWITIDEKMDDFDARIQTFDALSAGHPLQLTIRLPVQNIDRFRPLFRRCSALFIDKCGQTDSSVIESDIQGICNFLKTPLAGSIKRIYWYDRDKPSFFSPQSLHKQLFEADDLDLEKVFNAFPSAIISAIELDPRVSFSQFSYSDLGKLLSNLPHLTSVHISTDRLSGILETDMTPICLPLLHSLSVTILTSSRDPNWSILGYIIAPSVQSVSLKATLDNRHIFIGASELGRIMQPKRLSLEIVGKRYPSWDGTEILDYNLASVDHLIVTLQATEKGDIKPWWREELRSILVSMSYLAVFNLRFTGELASFQDIVGLVSCNVHVYCSRPFQSDPNPKQPWVKNVEDKTSFMAPLVKPGRQVERMALLIDRYELHKVFSQLTIAVSSLNTLIIRANKERHDNFGDRLPSTRLAWLESLQELDIRDVEFDFSYEIGDTIGALPNLVVLKCPVKVARQLLKYVHTPRLRQLTIVASPLESSIADWPNFVYLLMLDMPYDIDKRPPLSSIALEFYPGWTRFLIMVSAYSQPHKNRPEATLRSVELPGLPHPSILRPLVSALRGEYVPLENIPSISFRSPEDEGCDLCHYSGWKCVRSTNDYCSRHSPRNLVTITANSLEG
jgi:hypothetical protein